MTPPVCVRYSSFVVTSSFEWEKLLIKSNASSVKTRNIHSLDTFYIADGYLYYTYLEEYQVDDYWDYNIESHRINLQTLEDEICEPFEYQNVGEQNKTFSCSFDGDKLVYTNYENNSVRVYDIKQVNYDSIYSRGKIQNIFYIEAIVHSVESGPNTFFYSLDLNTEEIKLIGSWFTS